MEANENDSSLNLTDAARLGGNMSVVGSVSGGPDLYIENYSTWIKICFAVIGTVTLITSIVTCTAMSRTRRIPKAAKFLAMGLLTFDSGFIVFSTMRKFVLDPVVNTYLMVGGTLFLQLSYVTVGLMSLERYIVLSKPNFYLRHCDLDTIRCGACIVWTVCGCTFFVLRYPVCYIQHGDAALYVAGTCNMIVTVYYSLLVVAVLGSSFICYLKIFETIRRIKNTDHKRMSVYTAVRILKSYKSTSLVLVYFFVILCTSIAYIFILVFIRFYNLGVSELRISLEVVNIINCFLDPYLYVLWFSETKMECLKLLAPLSQTLSHKVEKMRMDIFGVVISDVSYSSTSLYETGKSSSN